jgi:glycosyltransferase involved in cell wall biosynthesis
MRSSTDRPSSIAFLTWRDQRHPDGGGSEVYVESVARELVARGHRVQIRCARYPGSAEREVVDGVEIVRNGGRLTVYARSFWWVLTAGRRTDVVIDVINGLPFMARLARRRGLVALVHHVHREQWHIIYPGWRGRLGWWIESRLTPCVYRDVVHVTVSESSRRDLVALGIDPALIHVAHNGLDPRPVVAADATGARLSVLARLVPHKQVDHAFRVVRSLRDRFPDIGLDVIGDGWWRDELVGAALAEGVEDRVLFHGRVSADRRDELLATSAAMLLPSVKEGWGLAVVEAAAQGTPTIAYRSAGGVTESVVDGETGLLVDTVDEMVEATAALLSDVDRRARMSACARSRAGTFTWSATTDMVERVIAQVRDQSP